MSWKDKLVPASYKGVKFSIESSDSEFGRRTELKQFPNNDSPIVQDFGQDASSFSVQAFIISSKENEYDYMVERDALIQAFNEAGVGILIHPYYGTMEVYPVGKISIAESVGEGGICRLSMSFVRVNEEIQKLILPSFKKQQPNLTMQGLPTESKDFNSIVDTAITVSDNDAMDNLGNIFSTGRAFIDKLKNATLGNLQKIQQIIFKIKGGFSSLLAQGTGLISGVVATIDNIIDTPNLLFTDLKNAANALTTICGIGITGFFGGTAGSISGTIRGEVVELDGETVPNELGKTTILNALEVTDGIDESALGFIPDAQINNIIIVNDTIKYLLIAASMTIAIRTDFLDKAEALTYADLIADSIEKFLERLGAETDESGYDYVEGDCIDNSMLHAAMEDLRNVFIQAMYAKAETISTLIEYEVPSETQSILELAFDKYEDLEREDEIYDMNRLDIRHPGFLPNGKTVRILNE